MLGENGGPPLTSEIRDNLTKITRARNLIQLKLSQLPEFIALTAQELGHDLNLNSDGDQSTLLMRFAAKEFGWAPAFQLWENDMAESSDNRHYFAERLDREYGHGWIFRTGNQADHEALLTYFEVEALVIPFEKGLINLRLIFDQVKNYRDKARQ